CMSVFGCLCAVWLPAGCQFEGHNDIRRSLGGDDVSWAYDGLSQEVYHKGKSTPFGSTKWQVQLSTHPTHLILTLVGRCDRVLFCVVLCCVVLCVLCCVVL